MRARQHYAVRNRACHVDNLFQNCTTEPMGVRKWITKQLIEEGWNEIIELLESIDPLAAEAIGLIEDLGNPSSRPSRGGRGTETRQ